MSNLQNEGNTYKLTSAVLTSDKIKPFTYEIVSCITDFNIYEDINKPYLTGKITFADFNNIINKVSFNGDEKLTLTIRKVDTEGEDIVKTFYLDYIMESKEVNNNSAEVYVFHMVEESEYESNLKNINKYYEGTPSEIINSIIKEYIPKRVFYPIRREEESNEVLKVIIPNLNPIEAIQWICTKAYTNDGLPFYLFTTLSGGNAIYYSSLRFLLKQSVLNDEPYTYVQSAITRNINEYGTSTREQNIINQNYQILSYHDRNTDDLRSLVNDGFVGATHRFVDVINGEEKKVKYDLGRSLVRLQELGLLSKNYLGYTYHVGAKEEEDYLSEKESTKIYNYPSLKPYELGFSNHTSMVEEKDDGNYNHKVNSLAILNLLYKRKIEVTLQGANFIGKDVNKTVGNLIHVLYVKPDNNDETKSSYDERKSGRQIITKTVHMFKQNDYQVKLELCKLESIQTEVNSSGGQDTQTLVNFFSSEGIEVI